MNAQPPYGRFSPSDPGVGPSHRYKVLLHHTADKDLMFVVRTVMELTRFGEAEATHRMWDAHFNGRTVVVVTHLERGELYVEQFASRGLHTSLEPA
jgi:ATP-dependent Clp protease adapter protein ClpS